MRTDRNSPNKWRTAHYIISNIVQSGVPLNEFIPTKIRVKSKAKTPCDVCGCLMYSRVVAVHTTMVIAGRCLGIIRGLYARLLHNCQGQDMVPIANEVVFFAFALVLSTRAPYKTRSPHG
jgi:hypothetical protein